MAPKFNICTKLYSILHEAEFSIEISMDNSATSRQSEWPIQMDTCLTPKSERTERSKRSGGHRSRACDYDQGPRQMEICNFRSQKDQTSSRPAHRVGSDRSKVRVIGVSRERKRTAGVESKQRVESGGAESSWNLTHRSRP